METSELTNYQLVVLAEKMPFAAMVTLPEFMANYDPDLMIEYCLGWMVVHRTAWMINHHLELILEKYPDLVEKHEIAWLYNI